MDNYSCIYIYIYGYVSEHTFLTFISKTHESMKIFSVKKGIKYVLYKIQDKFC